MSEFLGRLVVDDESNGGKHFVLVEDLTYKSDKFGLIKVEKGFQTDFASIPRGLWNILPPFGSYDRAGVVHDWMYYWGPARSWSRADADWALWEAMGALGVGTWTRRAIYAGVRLGGGQAWRNHRSKDAQ